MDSILANISSTLFVEQADLINCHPEKLDCVFLHNPVMNINT